MKECPSCGRLFEDEDDECPDDETPLCAMGEADPLIGTMAGSYRVARRIGRGGMGAVYAAEHPDIGSTVAIKVLHRKFAADSVAVERFFNEARAVNLIGRDNIVRIFDLARLADGTPYFVMELLHGRTLGELCGVRHPPAEVIPLFLQLTTALQATHAAGIVHRDLKPDNVFLADGPDGPRVKVLDFGIAKLSRPPGTKRTQTGAILGSARYLSPEQAAGDPSVGPASDIYSLGVMLFELLTGHPPFDAATYGDLLVAHRTQVAPRIRTLVPASPQSLDDLVASCLQKKPESRPASMDAFANSLRHVPLAEAPKVRRGPRAGQVLALSIPVAVIVTLGVIWMLIRPSPIPAEPLLQAPQETPKPVAPPVVAVVPAPVVETDAGVAGPVAGKEAHPHAERPPPEPRFTIPERVGDGMIDVEW